MCREKDRQEKISDKDENSKREFKSKPIPRRRSVFAFFSSSCPPVCTVILSKLCLVSPSTVTSTIVAVVSLALIVSEKFCAVAKMSSESFISNSLPIAHSLIDLVLWGTVDEIVVRRFRDGTCDLDVCMMLKDEEAVMDVKIEGNRTYPTESHTARSGSLRLSTVIWSVLIEIGV